MKGSAHGPESPGWTIWMAHPYDSDSFIEVSTTRTCMLRHSACTHKTWCRGPMPVHADWPRPSHFREQRKINRRTRPVTALAVRLSPHTIHTMLLLTGGPVPEV